MSKSSNQRVTIVLPAYNAEKLIDSTIQSVVNQTFEDWEMLVVDDCSTDGTRDIVQKWAEKDPRIKLIALSANFGGPAGPRNVGVREASGKFVAFLDSDDIWHPRKLEIQLQVLFKSNASFVCSQMKDFTSEQEILFDSIDHYHLEDVSFKQQSLRARIPTSSVIAERDLLKATPFVESIDYKAVEDYHCWLRLLESTPKCIKVLAPLLFYRKIDGQISGSKVYMMKKVFMVHRDYPRRSRFGALVLTLTHVLGGLYFRFIKKGM
ncbi:glycosyltransferase family 2 protein [Marinobacter salsuginis]|uniref:glycosyltransferase family 2 protein n=1 Tax=Marinobacter salsuginis TaxID=418719 RepID=UPI001AE06AC8|nr:glycosyltransferase family 2 protein [Marinobacter salsuginis]QTN40175.1 glycosyltransferase [Marinobacter salsuginis]